MRHATLGFLLAATACTTSSGEPVQPRDVLRTALTVARTVGDAIIRVDGYAALQKYAKEAIPLIDANGDQMVTLAEVEAAAATIVEQPELAAGLLAAAYFLHRKG